MERRLQASSLEFHSEVGVGGEGVLPKNQITRRNLLNLCFKLKKEKKRKALNENNYLCRPVSSFSNRKLNTQWISPNSHHCKAGTRLRTARKSPSPARPLRKGGPISPGTPRPPSHQAASSCALQVWHQRLKITAVWALTSLPLAAKLDLTSQDNLIGNNP